MYNSNEESVLWHSFFHPTDTFMAYMSVKVKMGENCAFTSCKSPNDLSPGNYTMGIDNQASSQLVIWEAKHMRWRNRHWDGNVFTSVPSLIPNYKYGFRIALHNGKKIFCLYIIQCIGDVQVSDQLGWVSKTLMGNRFWK